MSTLFDTYPNDARHMKDYIAYQRRYVDNIRESDRVILEIVSRLEAENLLDIGCSTGNLLRHIRQAFPKLTLTGGDNSDIQLDECRRDKSLAGIDFAKMDIRDLPSKAFDIVIANAILYGFSNEEFEKCIISIRRSLRQGGHFIAFDFFHPFAQEIEIIEKSAGFPGGHPLHFRSFGHARSVLSAAGFDRVDFRPFEIAIDLKKPSPESIVSYTIQQLNGPRLLFRGTLFQPWCHLIGRTS